MEFSQEYSNLLRTSIDQPLPCCTGVIQVSQKDLVIYYGKDESTCRLDFLHASDGSLERLAAACDPATFGRKHENVHDESYRKARKLGPEDFSPTLDINNLGLIKIVCGTLLRGSPSQKTVRAELYNLNVYGKDSFFMPHVDTPRSPAMFGSLVIFYPTRHEGGALVMRQGDKEWTFDSANVFSDGAESRIGYAAFYSDIQHEVKTVTAGHRVTITYNLYFEDSSELQPPISSSHASIFKATLQTLLLDEAFLPNGGRLAFGLQHRYPLAHGEVDSAFMKYLKGSDAEILQVAVELSLSTSIWTFVENEDDQYLCPVAPDCESRSFNESYSFDEWIRSEYAAKTLDQFKVHWITAPLEDNKDEQAYAMYGNSPTVEYAYNSIYLIIQIGKPGSRAEFEGLADDEEY